MIVMTCTDDPVNAVTWPGDYDYGVANLADHGHYGPGKVFTPP
jgi:hypothetical protein